MCNRVYVNMRGIGMMLFSTSRVDGDNHPITLMRSYMYAYLSLSFSLGLHAKKVNTKSSLSLYIYIYIHDFLYIV